jgi:hypothetical protein
MYAELKTKLVEMKYRFAIYSTVLMALVGYASAGALNTSISDILYAMADLFPSLVDLIIAAVPVIIVIALATFITSFLSSIVSKLR